MALLILHGIGDSGWPNKPDTTARISPVLLIAPPPLVVMAGLMDMVVLMVLAVFVAEVRPAPRVVLMAFGLEVSQVILSAQVTVVSRVVCLPGILAVLMILVTVIGR